MSRSEGTDQPQDQPQTIGKVLISRILLRNDGYRVYLFGIILAGFLIRMYYLNKIALRGDEIAYLYDSYLITKGQVPLVDYHARTPIYLYFVSLFLRVFGNSIEGARMSSAVVSTMTIYFVYLLARKLFERRIALSTAAIFSFSPFSIKYGTMLIPEVLLTLIFVIALLFVVKSLQNNDLRYLVIAGVIMGLSIYIRRTAGLSIVIFPLSMFVYFARRSETGKWLSRDVINKSIFRGAVFFISFLVGFLPLFSIFVHLISLEYMTALFSGSSAGQGVTIHQFPNYFIITYIPWLSYRNFFMILLFSLYLLSNLKVIGSKIPQLHLLFPFLLFSFYVYISPYSSNNDINVLGLVVFFLASIPLSFLKKLQRDDTVINMFGLIFGFIFIILIILHQQYYGKLGSQMFTLLVIGILLGVFQDRIIGLIEFLSRPIRRISRSIRIIELNNIEGMEKIPKDRVLQLAVTIGALLFILFLEESIYDAQEKALLNISYLTSIVLVLFLLKFHIKVQLRSGDFIIMIWFGVTFLFYANYGQFLDYYYYEFLIPISLGGGVGLVRLRDSIPKDMNDVLFALLSVLVASMIISNSLIRNIDEQEKISKLPSPTNIREVADYLESVTDPGDEIFTMSLAVAVTADLRNVMDISHAYFYHSPDLYIDRDLLRYPTLFELQDYLLENQVMFAVVDWATSLDYFDMNPDFESFFYLHYTLMKTIGIIGVYRLSEDFWTTSD